MIRESVGVRPLVALRVLEAFRGTAFGQPLADDTGPANTYGQLSGQEVGILTAMSQGWSNRVIAAELAISESTVKRLVGEVLRKLAVNNRTRAVVVALRDSWIELPGTMAVRGADDRLTAANEELRHHVAELEQRNQEMTRLARLGDLLQSCQTAQELAVAVARSVGPLFSGDAGALYELATSGRVVEAVAVWGDPPPVRRVFSPTQCWGLRRGRLHVADDSKSELRCEHVEEPIRTGTLCAPLVAQGETLGLLHLQVREPASPKDRSALLADRERLTKTLAEQLELALANFRLRATLREQSTRDPLTGLFNRRFMEESLDRELRRARREGYELGLLMIDLDHFKVLNDGLGHAAGDAVLRAIGGFLLTAVRGEDVACRFGGEEFVLILPKASPADMRRRAEALLEGARRLRVDASGTVLPTVTMSIGVASTPEHGETCGELLRSADVALYQAKAAGRDRVVVADLGRRPEIEVFQRTGPWPGPASKIAR
jgi:diguanylate cyclase (GGDEF)-like protein